MAFGEEISKILPDWSHPGRAEKALAHLLDDMEKAPLVPEEDVNHLVEAGHFVWSTITQPWRLSATQKEVLYAMSRGQTPTEIAERKGIRRKTVAEHLERARVRLRCKTNEEAVAVAIGSGIIPAVERDPLEGDRLNVSRLTDKHKEVLKLIALGYSSEEAAEKLGVSTEAVKDRVERICEIMGARNRTHAVSLAFMTGRLKLSTSVHKNEKGGAPKDAP